MSEESKKIAAFKKADGKKELLYLCTWKFDNSNWKFQKNVQSFLLKNILDEEVIPKRLFKILIKYLKGLQGKSAKDRVKDLCNRAIDNSETSEAIRKRATKTLKALD
jgi:hypothetical protein